MLDDPNASDWYREPLKFDDILAASIFLVFGVFFIGLYTLVAYVMYRSDKEIVGFRFLFSASITDILLLFNYTVWPALTILFKSEIISRWQRHWLQMYLDWIWFSMCYHYVAIAWSRFAAIYHGISFRIQPRILSYGICACCYIAALIQVLCTHFQPWYTTFYFDPAFFGMLSENFTKYLNEGQSLFFATFHLLMILIPAVFYGLALYLLLRHRRNGILARQPSLKNVKSSSKQARAETRLIFPCLLNSVVFLIGQVAITVGTGEGKWSTFAVMILFSMNSAVNPALLLAFSPIIREKVLRLFFRGHKAKFSYSRNASSATEQHYKQISTTILIKNDSMQYCEQAFDSEEEIRIFAEIFNSLDDKYLTYV